MVHCCVALGGKLALALFAAMSYLFPELKFLQRPGLTDILINYFFALWNFLAQMCKLQIIALRLF